MDTKEWRESEERATEEENEDKDDDTEDEGGRPAGAPLEYYDDFSDSDSVEAAATTVLRDGNDGADYKSAPPPAAGASNGDGANVRGGNGNRGN